MHSKHEAVTYNSAKCEYKATHSNLPINQMSQLIKLRYSCEQCDYKITQWSSAATHEKSKHEGVTYKCVQCEYETIRKFPLTTHKYSKHEQVQCKCEYEATEQCNLEMYPAILGGWSQSVSQLL